jgi:NMD protein affecting ribosome stability and mRNA decay
VQAKVNIFGKAPDEKIDNLMPSRKCPECGKPMEARRRLCRICASARQRDAARTAMAKRRLAVST